MVKVSLLPPATPAFQEKSPWSCDLCRERIFFTAEVFSTYPSTRVKSLLPIIVKASFQYQNLCEESMPKTATLRNLRSVSLFQIAWVTSNQYQSISIKSSREFHHFFTIENWLWLFDNHSLLDSTTNFSFYFLYLSYTAPLCPCLELPESFKEALGTMMDMSLLKNSVFLLICISNVFGMAGLYIPFFYLVDYVKEKVSNKWNLFKITIFENVNRLLSLFQMVTGDWTW